MHSGIAFTFHLPASVWNPGCRSAHLPLPLSGRRDCPSCLDATLPCTVLQRCPMPLILKEPEGWELSIFRNTLVPATLDNAMLSRSGVFTCRDSWVAMAGGGEERQKVKRDCPPGLYDPSFVPIMIRKGQQIKSQLRLPSGQISGQTLNVVPPN